MKNILLITFITSTLFANAQLGNKGQRIASATINLNSNTTTTTNPSNYNNSYKGAGTSFSIGKFTKTNTFKQFGINANFTDSKNSYLGNTRQKRSYLSIFYNNVKVHKLFQNWYWAIINEPYLLMENASSTYNGTAPEYTKDKSLGIGYTIKPAVYYKLNNKWVLSITASNVLNANANFGTRETKSNGTIFTDKNWNANLQAGFWNAPLQNIGIGINYIW